MDLLVLTEDNKSHFVYIKVLTGLYLIKQRIKIKNRFVRAVYNALVMKEW